MFRSRNLIAPLCFLFFFAVHSQQIDEVQLDTFLTKLGNDKFMGNLLVKKEDRTIYAQSLGFTDVEQKVSTRQDDQYRIGSISKTFTAVLVLKAVEEGKIELSQSLASFFPSVANANKIRLGQLLNHHSGIPNFTNAPDFLQWHSTAKSEQEMVDVVSRSGSDFEPGTMAAYSNSNYVLLSYILQSVYQQSYAELLEEKIIAPLGLRHTQFGDTTVSATSKTLSYVYEVGWNKSPETNLTIAMGAGGILSTTDDLARFIDGLFKGTLLSKRSLDLMLEQKDGYGMGIFKTQLFEKDAYTHDGKIDGFNSVYYHFPDEKVTYVLLSNAENYDLGIVHRAVLAYALGDDYLLPALKTYSVTPQGLLPYLGVYRSQESPLVITISSKGNKLLAQPEGQKIYAMDAVDKDLFKHDKSGVVLSFDPTLGAMLMKQGEQTLRFMKQ
ncbi:serine hydrolase domain-containing protein [Allomuricauda taeanensis]|uniref:serine hydrolase domain-containing protein n=1 Tax=Flagellimonas taeanensis TaxID=1005926 RepID=UPI002E7AC81B|nr:serine hydrolase domain-containing protein [Allomuricauda taeanensis]MEE1963457.1 serine hydrolase domain-containing protein [Allomuricauda taeanensis]